MRSAALLRGINVGGRNPVRMDHLRSIVGSIGATDVTTYLQSGNVIFDAPIAGPELEAVLSASLARELGFDVPIVTRTSKEMTPIARSHPFDAAATGDRRLYVVFLSAPPTGSTGKQVSVPDGCTDRLLVRGREVYLDLANAGRTKLTLTWLERQLGVTGTQRNWRTTKAVDALLRDRS